MLRAEQVGLVEREQSGLDARVAHMSLTEEGERRLALAFKSHEGERRLLRQMLARLESKRAEENALSLPRSDASL